MLFTDIFAKTAQLPLDFLGLQHRNTKNPQAFLQHQVALRAWP